MKNLIIAVALLMLVGCKSVNVKVTDDDGADWDISYFVWGKSELSDVEAKVGAVSFNLGKSLNDSPTGLDKAIDAIISGKLVAVPQ